MKAQTQSGTGLKEQQLDCYLGLLKVGSKPLGYYYDTAVAQKVNLLLILSFSIGFRCLFFQLELNN